MSVESTGHAAVRASRSCGCCARETEGQRCACRCASAPGRHFTWRHPQPNEEQAWLRLVPTRTCASRPAADAAVLALNFARPKSMILNSISGPSGAREPSAFTLNPGRSGPAAARAWAASSGDKSSHSLKERAVESKVCCKQAARTRRAL